MVPLHVIAFIAAVVGFSAPALAELQTVPSGQATQYAKPMQKQKVDKGFVALLFAGGAASLFGSAVLLEKNSQFFPAIYKANQVMREAEKRNQGRAIAEQAVVDLEKQDDMRLQRSVEAGLAQAKARVVPESRDKDAASSSGTVDPEIKSRSSATGSTHTDSHVEANTTTGDGGSHGITNDEAPSSNPERSKGSQLSATEKQENAVKTIS